MTQSWVDRHRPTNWSDIQGNNSALDSIKNWAEDWSPGDEPILLVGPPGVGKTSTAEVVARSLGVQTVEINASSARRTADLAEMAAQIRSAGEGGRRLILIDEVDSWHHGADKTVLYDALDRPANPVIMTANDEWDVADGIKSRAETYEFKLGKRSRKAKLRKVAEAEGFDLEDHELNQFAKRPDLRSAINDLQIFAESEGPATADDRVWETSEWDMLDDVLTGTPDLGSISPPDALMWLDESCSAEYRGLEMAMAYEAMALADVSLGRAREKGYRHWRYARTLLEEVALIRRTEPYFGDEISYNNKSFPEWFRHKKPNPSGGSAEALLYRAVKDASGYEFQGNFVMFLQTYLPILKDLPKGEKFEIILSYRLDPEEYEALGISKAEFEDWAEVAAPEAGTYGGTVQDASQW